MTALRHARRLSVLLPLMLFATPTLAQGPEQLDQIEPGAGQWQAEYYGAFNGDGEQVLEVLYGLNDRLVLGAEVEFEGPSDGLRLEEVGLVALYRVADPQVDPVGVGVQVEAGLDRGGRLSGVEGRLILEKATTSWWLQGDLIVRHSREDGEQGTGIAYGGAINRSVGGGLWFGVEASGRLVRLAGDAELAPEGQHYFGPTLTFEKEFGGSEVELGAAWFERIAGDGAGSGPRVFVQITF